MPNNTTITDEQYAEALAVIAERERQQYEELGRRRQALYDVVRPLVESEEFISVHEQIVALRNQGLSDNGFFDIQLDAAYNGMNGLGIQVANWIPVVTNPAPQPVVPTPTEGTDNAE